MQAYLVPLGLLLTARAERGRGSDITRGDAIDWPRDVGVGCGWAAREGDIAAVALPAGRSPHGAGGHGVVRGLRMPLEAS